MSCLCANVVRCLPVFLLIACQSGAFGQEAPSAGPGTQVVIQREAIKVSDPKKYQISLQLTASPQVEITAEVDGLIRKIHSKPGQRMDTNSEVISFDQRRAELELTRAAAHVKVAEAELKSASAAAKELAEARVEAAKADLEVAKFQREKTSVRVPFAGEIFRIHVAEGQFVRAGQPLMSFGDASKLTVEIPVDRGNTKENGEIELRIENQTVQATVDSIMPVKAEFEPLRELAGSVASAKVVFDNPANRFHVGQAVYPRLIPRQTITEVPTAALSNQKSGQRKVQVVREHTIRDISVTLLGQVGNDRVFVSGAFQPSDEIIVESSQPLPDGTQVRPSTTPLTSAAPSTADDSSASTAADSSGKNSSKDEKAKKKKSVGF